MLVLVCYDVTNDARRERLSAMLSGFGDRIQYSVFACALSDLERRQLLRRLTRYVRDEDVRVYTVCEPDRSKIVTDGGDDLPVEPGAVFL